MTPKPHTGVLRKPKKGAPILVIVALFLAHAQGLSAQQSRLPLEPSWGLQPKAIAPVVLCIDDPPKGGGQPSTLAYAKAAADGFRSVLTLRSAADGVDLPAERFMVESNQLRYFNIPANSKLPSRERVVEFLRLTRDPDNHPMLINCAFAERVAPFMMMFRILEQGWSQEKALKEATAAGLKAAPLKRFAAAYLAQLRPKPDPTAPNSKDSPIQSR